MIMILINSKCKISNTNKFYKVDINSREILTASSKWRDLARKYIISMTLTLER